MRSRQKMSLLSGFVVGVLAISACQRVNPTPAVTSSLTATIPGITQAAPQTESPYPGPEEVIQPTSTHDGYPAPGGPEAAASAYPGPEGSLALTSTPTSDIYPGPGTAIAQVPVGPSPTSDSAYPGPIDGTSDLGPYPAPVGSATPTLPGAPTQLTTPTPLRATPTIVAGGTTPTSTTATPSVTPTPALVRTRLEASDPAAFQLASGETQLVEFFAVWSPLSKSMAPVMNGLEERYKHRINFVYLDIDDPANSLYKLLLGDRLPPIFYLLDGEGNVLKEWRGYTPAQEFEAVFNSPTP